MVPYALPSAPLSCRTPQVFCLQDRKGRNVMKTFAVALATAMMLATAHAQGPAAPPAAAAPFIDWDKIQIKTTDLGNNTYMLEGQGGNITVAVGTDGIIMVDG